MNPITDTEAPALLTIPQAATLLAVSKRTLEREIDAGKFPRPVRIGRAVRVTREDLGTYIASLRPQIASQRTR